MAMSRLYANTFQVIWLESVCVFCLAIRQSEGDDTVKSRQSPSICFGAYLDSVKRSISNATRRRPWTRPIISNPMGHSCSNSSINVSAESLCKGRWRSWLSHLSYTQKVLSSSLGRLIFSTLDRPLLAWGVLWQAQIRVTSSFLFHWSRFEMR